MKVALVMCLLAMVLAYNGADAWFRGGFGRFGGFGGFGFRRFGFGGFGPFGFRRFGFGFGGFGFRPIIPVPVPVPFPPFGGPFIGKRAADDSLMQTESEVSKRLSSDMPKTTEEHMEMVRRAIEEMNAEVMDTTNRTTCTYSSTEKMITCRGKTSELTCKAIPNFNNLDKFSFNLDDLMIVEDVLPINHPSIIPITYKLFSHDETNPKLLNEYTVMSSEKTPYLFSVYNSEFITENGFRIEDTECWKKFDTMMKTVKPTDARMSLIISNN